MNDLTIDTTQAVSTTSSMFSSTTIFSSTPDYFTSLTVGTMMITKNASLDWEEKKGKARECLLDYLDRRGNKTRLNPIRRVLIWKVEHQRN